MADSNNLRNYHMHFIDSKASQFNIHTEVNYNKSEIIRAGFWADYTNYYLPNKFYANFTPSFVSGLQANYKYEQNWEFGMQVFGWSNRQYMRGSSLETLKGSADVNLNASYHYNSNVSAFIQLNNVANQKYSYTLGYPVYGINGLIGLVLRY
jgi:vitamin B12 transporter